MDSGQAMMYLAAYIIGLVVSAFIFALVFNVKEHFKLMRKQIDLLVKIAEKQGCTYDELNEIVSK